MSANSWGVCPQCVKNENDRIEAQIKDVQAHYGKVSEATYRKMLYSIDSPTDSHPRDLREDWEIFTDEDGTLSIDYSCSCGVCGLNYRFNKKENVLT